LNDEQRAAIEELARVSDAAPRAHLGDGHRDGDKAGAS
jgi:hypothetical protein